MLAVVEPIEEEQKGEEGVREGGEEERVRKLKFGKGDGVPMDSRCNRLKTVVYVNSLYNVMGTHK